MWIKIVNTGALALVAQYGHLDIFLLFSGLSQGADTPEGSFTMVSSYEPDMCVVNACGRPAP